MDDGTDATDGLCMTCNDGDGMLRQVEVIDRDGDRRRFVLVLCPECVSAFDGDESTTVTAPDESAVCD